MNEPDRKISSPRSSRFGSVKRQRNFGSSDFDHFKKIGGGVRGGAREERARVMRAARDSSQRGLETAGGKVGRASQTRLSVKHFFYSDCARLCTVSGL